VRSVIGSGRDLSSLDPGMVVLRHAIINPAKAVVLGLNVREA
jgi:hypothetical protein